LSLGHKIFKGFLWTTLLSIIVFSCFAWFDYIKERQKAASQKSETAEDTSFEKGNSFAVVVKHDLFDDVSEDSLQPTILAVYKIGNIVYMDEFYSSPLFREDQKQRLDLHSTLYEYVISSIKLKRFDPTKKEFWADRSSKSFIQKRLLPSQHSRQAFTASKR
jgi:hypothetical protein